jgi:DNA ligase-1
LFPVNGANNRIFDSANLGSQFRIFLKQKNAEYQTTLYSLPRTATRIQAILVYAEADSRTSFYRKFCFALPNEEGKLITIAKLEVELEEVELADLNQWIRTNVIQKFGPVRTVALELVFDLEYDQLKVSQRHKSGFNLLGVRCIGRRRELSPSDATRLNAL